MDQPQIIYNRPAHLLQESWVDFEYRAAANLLAALEAELKKLKLRLTVDRVHKSRVSLRRWFSVWGFLAEDGWEEKKFKKKVLAPLREFLKRLGDLRDCDVNIQTAEKLACDEETLEELRETRKKLKHHLDESLAEIDPAQISAQIDSYLERKAGELDEFIQANPQQDHSSFNHFDRYLGAHEEQVKKLADRATTPEAMHKLRLAIKKWRYLLTECMGLTNLELVRAQTLLGEIHDLDRLEPLLEEEHSGALSRLTHERDALVSSFEQLKPDLPFNLRPGTISYLYSPTPNILDD